MPLSLLTVPVLGEAVLRDPAPRPVYRKLLGQGLSPAAAAAAPGELLDVLRLAARRTGNARTIASLMHAIDAFRRPRADSVMTDGKLRQITAPTMFCWGTGAPFPAPAQARPASPKSPQQCSMKSRAGHLLCSTCGYERAARGSRPAGTRPGILTGALEAAARDPQVKAPRQAR